MRQIKRGTGLLLAVAFLGGCNQEVDRGFCASHAADHWQHRQQHPVLQISYAADGEMMVQLTLPDPLAALLSTAGPADILSLPAQCVAQELQRSSQRGTTSLQFRAACAEEQPASLGVPLLLEHADIQEVEVSMTTPAVRKHFIVHQRCDRALFNIAEGTDIE